MNTMHVSSVKSIIALRMTKFLGLINEAILSHIITAIGPRKNREIAFQLIAKYQTLRFIKYSLTDDQWNTMRLPIRLDGIHLKQLWSDGCRH